MIDDEEICCMCGEHKKFLARVNTGKKLYCIQCKAKIIKEYGTDYWKPCSFAEFFGAWSKEIKAKRGCKSTGNWSLLKKQLREIEEDKEQENEE